MRHPPHWKTIAAFMAMLAGVVLAASPGFSQDPQNKTDIESITREDADSPVLVLRSGALLAPITFISMKTEDL